MYRFTKQDVSLKLDDNPEQQRFFAEKEKY